MRYEIEYTKGERKGETEIRPKTSLEKDTPRYMTKDEWYMYLLSIIEYDKHDYWKAISIIEATVEFIDTVNTKDIKMKGVRLLDMLIENINRVKIEQREGECVIDYIWNVIKGKEGFTRYSYEKLRG